MFATKLEIIFPEIRASLPITTFIFFLSGFLAMINAPYADANFTASIGVKLSAVLPPMVPLIPDIDFINVILLNVFFIFTWQR